MATTATESSCGNEPKYPIWMRVNEKWRPGVFLATGSKNKLLVTEKKIRIPLAARQKRGI